MSQRGAGPRRAAVASLAAVAVIAAALPTVLAPRPALAAVPVGAGVPLAVAGAETVPPIPVRPGTGPLRPTLPAALAEVPGGTAENGENPFLRIDSLTDPEWPATVTVRLYDASLGLGESATDNDNDHVWEGQLTRGWGRVTENLVAGHGYAAWARLSSGTWQPLGRFGVRGALETSGPTTGAGGLTASLASGELTWGWSSPTLPGPAGGVGVGLNWLARAPEQTGLPAGWRLMVSSGSPWASLTEAGPRLKALTAPSAPVVSRVDGQRVRVGFTYPLAGRIQPRAFLLQQRVNGRWVPLRPGGAVTPGSRLATLARGATAVRVGLLNRGVTVYSRPSLVRAEGAPPVTAVAPEESDECGSAISTVPAPEAVVLQGWSGASMTFRRNDFGLYEQAFGGDRIPGYRNTLGFCDTAAGRVWTFTDASGLATRFVRGRAARVTDQGQPLSTLTWSGGRLVRVTNGVGRSIGLVYAGAGDCPSAGWGGYATPPEGLLCRLEYPGGVATDLGYLASGLPSPQIGLVKDPGNAATALGWDAVGRLAATRSPLVNRAATVVPDAAGAIATAAYDGFGRVSSLVEAPAAVGAEAATQTLALPVIGEAQLRAGTAVTSRVTSTATGYEMFSETVLDPVTLDPSTSRDAAGSRTTTSTSGRTTTSTDPRGLVTTTTFDARGNVVSQSGPALPGQASPGTEVSAQYDTVGSGTNERQYEGFRALVYGREQFQGGVSADYWAPKPGDGNGLAAAWTVPSDAMSAVATALWTPTAAQDAAARDAGWAFELSTSGGAVATLIVEGAVCQGTSCTIARLPQGAKQVTVEIERGTSEGWFTVLAAPGGTKPATVPTAQVRPGFGNLTRVRSNDVTATQTDPATEYVYDQPETGKATRASFGGGLSARLEYESGAPGQGRWGRLLRFTTPGGLVQRTSYWRDSGTMALPDPCGGTGAMAGQPRTIARQDGIAVTSYYDERGRLVAGTTTGDGGTAETVCTTYSDDNTPVVSSVYDDQGVLVERTETVVGVDGDPLTQQQTTTHGPGAAIDPGAVVVTRTSFDLRGNPVRYVDATGTVTTSTYTPFNDPEHVTVTLEGASSPLLTFDYAYRREDGAPTTVKVNDVLAAQVSYAAGKASVDSVTYAGGAARLGLQYAASGRPSTLVATAGASRYTQSLEFNDFGRILSARISSTEGGPASTEARGYAYDSTGRLTSAIISTTPAGGSVRRTTYGYGYATSQAATCGAPAAEYPRAGADALRTGGTRAGVAYVMCHDGKSRLYATTDPLVTGDPTAATRAAVSHDALGRVTAITGISRPLQMTWGAGSDLAQVVEGDGGDAVTTTLSTFAGQIVGKTVQTPAGEQSVRYAYSSPQSGSPLLTLPPERAPPGGVGATFPLPGGARVDAVPGAVPTLTFTGLDGSALATVAVPALAITGISGATAPTTGLSPRFGPYGEALVLPSLTATGARPSYTWQAGQSHETLAGTASLTLLGARTYLPATGEFLSPDPESSSGGNLYSYTPADPINGSDPTGRANGWSWFWQVVAVVLIVVAVAIDVATLGAATPATGAGVAAWVGYVGLTVGVPMVAWWAVGKAQEMSFRSQTEPSEGLDSVRAAMGWVQLIENVGFAGHFLIGSGYRAARAVRTWWKDRSVKQVFKLTKDLQSEAAEALGRTARSTSMSVTQPLVFGAIEIGGRDALQKTTGRLSVGSSRITGTTLRLAADRKTFFHISDFMS